MLAVNLQKDIDSKNADFWQELCGTQLAQKLGVVDSQPESLAKFDKYYLDFYPYLKKYLHLDQLKSKNVLEVGLGYGTVSQLLGLAGANYHGLDIAENPVNMVRHRLAQHNLQGDVRVGSMLECPFPDNYFDFVFSIGCFHHTGNVKACIDQTFRVLKKGGCAIIMVYNKYSFRQWNSWPLQTLKGLIQESRGKIIHSGSEAQRQSYDASSAQQAAPETVFCSVGVLKGLFKNYQSVQFNKENFDEGAVLNFFRFPVYKFKKREQCLGTRLTDMLGLDLYIEAYK